MPDIEPFNRITAKEESINFLYKYRHLDDHTENIFCNNEIYFASVSMFNDPFDSKCFIHTECNYKQRFEFILKRFRSLSKNKDLKNYFLNTSFESDEYENKIKQRLIVRDILEENIDLQSAVDSFAAMIRTLGVFSLTRSKDNILMWTHYAADHSGICLEFEISDDNSVLSNASKVVYSNQYPVVDYVANINNNLNHFDKVLLTKSKIWEYEQEYRAIRIPIISENPLDNNSDKTAYGVYNIPEETLTGVILGCKIDRGGKDKVMKWIGSRKIKPKLYQATMKNKEYGLDIIEFPS